jgi:hypothetical protein
MGAVQAGALQHFGGMPRRRKPLAETPAPAAVSAAKPGLCARHLQQLGLLALRLLAGDHDTTNPQHLPAATPDLLRQVITDTLT